ncbi:MAG: hypothetical protein GF334_07665 [Candidatus Altiarchaeales archaeon]|nr:hypothetical protein [Candidatus Altiarchaeales archaeon]
MTGVESINLDKNICQRYVQTKTNLIKKGKPTGDFDLWVACTCLEYNLTLTTRNLKHYENIDQLKTRCV